MTHRRSILCPIDFSDASIGALRYATALAGHFDARLILLTVEDPLLTQAGDLGARAIWSPEDSRKDMKQFVSGAYSTESAAVGNPEYEVAVGKPAPEILRVARERSCDLIVISTHGLTGIRKLFFGSTTERVLRETTRPVLVTPPVDPGVVRMEEASRLIRRILVPVDLSASSRPQIELAGRLGEMLDVPLLLLHVSEPVKSRLAVQLGLAGLEAERRAEAEAAVTQLVASVPARVQREAFVVTGDAAEEIARVAREREAGLIVMGLHGSPFLGPRMGSVTYRLLCLAPALVLALPPPPADLPDD